MIALDKDEHVIFEIRKHWFVYVLEITFLFLLAIAPPILIFVFNVLPIEVELAGSSLISLASLLYAAWLLVLWVVGFVFWTDYYLDVWVITNKKLLDVEQKNLFRREVSILHLDKIQDVTSEVVGVMATMVNYGDIHVQTAGQQREFIIHSVHRPDEVRQKLNAALMRYKEEVSNLPQHSTQSHHSSDE